MVQASVPFQARWQYGQVKPPAGRLTGCRQNSQPRSTARRSRKGERIEIRRPVASLTASMLVRALENRVASTWTISTTRTVTTRPLTFAV
jgi:hypothetical protein